MIARDTATNEYRSNAQVDVQEPISSVSLKVETWTYLTRRTPLKVDWRIRCFGIHPVQFEDSTVTWWTIGASVGSKRELEMIAASYRKGCPPHTRVRTTGHHIRTPNAAKTIIGQQVLEI